MEPPIRAVRAPQALLEFERLAGRQRALLCSDERRQIVWMYHIAGLPLLHVGHAAAVVFLSGPVFQFELTRRVVDRNQGWNVVDDRTELPLARSQQIFRSRRLFCAVSIVDVDVRSAPTGQSARVIMKRRGAEEEPAILAVGAPQAHFDLTRAHRRREAFASAQSDALMSS